MHSIRNKLAVGAILMLAISADPSAGQAVSDTTQIELVAARAMLTHRESGNVTVALDPRFGGSEGNAHATPGAPAARAVRSQARTSELARMLGGDVRTLEQVMCDQCPLKGVSMHLTLTSPRIEGSTAVLSATLIQNSGHARQPIVYETSRFTLAKTRGGWAVTKVEQLGIS